jgi:dTDP-glucose 4,6-dehydratase
MRILVTGGLGTVGTVLVSELRARGHEVWLCDLHHHHDKEYIRCDVSQYRQVERLFEGSPFDYVYHLAAEFGRWNGEDHYENLWATNVVGTKNLLKLQEEKRFRMVFFSSSEVYGDWPDVMSEDVMQTHEVKQLNDYAITKWVSELQILNHTRMAGTESVRVRLFNTYGPGEYYSPYRSVVCRFAYCALHDLPYEVYLNHHRTSTYVTDTVRTLANIADNFKPGQVYNIGGVEYHDIKQLSDLILGYLGKSDARVVYKEAEPHTTRDKKIDITKAVRDLDHRPLVKLEDGLKLTLDWMKDVYRDTIPTRVSEAA